MTGYKVDDQDTVWLNDRICVPQDATTRQENLTEVHNSKYSIHPGCTKMYQNLEDHFWWNDEDRHSLVCS